MIRRKSNCKQCAQQRSSFFSNNSRLQWLSRCPVGQQGRNRCGLRSRCWPRCRRSSRSCPGRTQGRGTRGTRQHSRLKKRTVQIRLSLGMDISNHGKMTTWRGWFFIEATCQIRVDFTLKVIKWHNPTCGNWPGGKGQGKGRDTATSLVFHGSWKLIPSNLQWKPDAGKCYLFPSNWLGSVHVSAGWLHGFCFLFLPRAWKRKLIFCTSRGQEGIQRYRPVTVCTKNKYKTKLRVSLES